MNQLLQSSLLKSLNIYEVNLRQYTEEGTIQAFIKHLPRLRDMGVEILWMMPIHPIGIINRKGTLGSYYSVKDFCDINPEYGTKQDFKILVEAVHTIGMKIIIDWVANHAAWDNNWTVDNPDFFVRDEAGSFVSPYDWSDVIQINHSNDDQQAGMINAMQYWVLEFDIDGFRADLAHLTPLSFWRNARTVIDKMKPGLVWLAETEEPAYYDAFDINYAWKWMHLSESFFKTGTNVTAVTAFLEKQRAELPQHAFQLYFTTNHDENSWNGTEYEKYGIYTKALTVFSFTYPGSVPLIYSGQELPNLKRLEFFEKDPIAWTDTIKFHSFYKILAAFHKNNFDDGDFRFLSAGENILAYSYRNSSRGMLVFLNLGKERATTDFINTGINASYTNIFTGELLIVSENISVEMEAGGYLLLGY